MTDRGYKVSPEWWEPTYRGKDLPSLPRAGRRSLELIPIYPEHQDTYSSKSACGQSSRKRDSIRLRKRTRPGSFFTPNPTVKCFTIFIEKDGKRDIRTVADLGISWPRRVFSLPEVTASIYSRYLELDVADAQIVEGSQPWQHGP